MIWEWLVVALFVALVIVIGWLAVEARHDGREKEAARRRTAEERLQQARERMERRRRLGLDKEDT